MSLTSPISSVTLNPGGPIYTMTFRRHDGSEETATVGSARCAELWGEAMPSLACACGLPFVAYGAEQATIVGSLFREPGHDHNDNCHTREYRCAAGHATTIAIVQRCPACSWTGKRSCGVCRATFVDAWPEVRP